MFFLFLNMVEDIDKDWSQFKKKYLKRQVSSPIMILAEIKITKLTEVSFDH